jgi:hypothetical protein
VQRDELHGEQEIYDAADNTRRTKRLKGSDMPERKVAVTLPTGAQGEGVEVQVKESTERWSDFALEDGSVLRAKLMILSAVRVDNEYDQSGNPVYVMNVAPVFTVVNSPDEYRKKD